MNAAPNGYGTVARLFHWVVAVLVLVQIAAGVAMTSEPLTNWTAPVYLYHKGAGAVLLVLVLARALWRLTHRAPPFPDYMPPLEQRIAHATHVAIYVLLVAMVVSGYVHTVGGGFPVEMLDALGIPPLVPNVPRIASAMLVVHEFAVVALVGLVAVHISAVLRHRLIDGNPILARMWPPVVRRGPVVVVTILCSVAPAEARAQVEPTYPPPFPRPGTSLLLENERVLVWNISWLKQEYPTHRHQYDHVGVYYTAGDRIIISPEGERRASHTEPWNITFQPRGVTHAEQGASDEPLRAVFVQIKDEPRTDAPAPAADPAFPVDGPVQRLENERAVVWDYGAADSVAPMTHRHARDAVAVSFGPAGGPQVRYVPRGTRHDTDLVAGSTRTFVFEIK
jgi:cytochrome b561